jgi:hypothetical protein
MKTKLSILILTLFTIQTFCQPVTLMGKVINDTDSMGIAGASVTIGHYGCITDSKGNFQLNADAQVVRSQQLSCSMMGYLSINLHVDAGKPILIVLTKDVKQLAEITVSSGVKHLLQTAYQRIEQNYHTTPFMMEGLLKLHYLQDNGYAYSNEAIVSMYHYGYRYGGKESDVMLVGNKVKVIRPSAKDTLLAIRWLNAYRTASINDFVQLQPAFIHPRSMKDFHYVLRGKAAKETGTVYVIDFYSTARSKGVTYKQMEGTLYIDTATYAYTGGEFTYYGIRQERFVPVQVKKVVVSYRQVNGKWYLHQVEGYSENEGYRQINSRSQRVFLLHALDTIHVKAIGYSNRIQTGDVTQYINKNITEGQWAVYDSLFRKAEREERFPLIHAYAKDTVRYKKPPGAYVAYQKAAQYLFNNNYRLVLGFGRLPVTMKLSNAGANEQMTYGPTVGGQIRVYKGLFAGMQSMFDVKLKRNHLQTNQYTVSYEIEFNKGGRPFTLSPFAGVTTARGRWEGKRHTYRSCQSGLVMALEWTHRKSFFIHGQYNQALEGGNKTNLIQLQPVSFSAGLIKKFK